MFNFALRKFGPRGRTTAPQPRAPLEIVAAWLGEARLGESAGGLPIRRRHTRWTWRKRLLIALDDQRLRVRAVDLSSSGVGVLVTQRLTVGARLQIGGGHDHVWIEGRVAYVDTQATAQGLFRTGIEFVVPGTCDARPG